MTTTTKDNLMGKWADKKAHSVFRYCETWNDLVEDGLLWTADPEDIAQALRDERERCAEVAEMYIHQGGTKPTGRAGWDGACRNIAAAIRGQSDG